MIQVKGPDGAIIQFPDGTKPAVIQDVMARHYGGEGGTRSYGSPQTARVIPLPAPAPNPGLFGDKTAPYGVGGMVANAVGAKDPAYQAALAREHQLDQYRTRGVPSQVTAPFMPYLQYGAGYGSQALTNVARAATGQPVNIPAATAGQAAMDDERTQQAAWAKAHPAQAIAGNVAGMAVLGPARAGTVIRGVPYAPGVKAASTLGQKALNVLKNVGTGAGLGTAYGAAEAPDGQHLQGAITGGLTGGLTAGALSGVAAVAPKMAAPVVNLVKNRLGPAMEGASVPKAPARQAAAYVTKKLAQAGVGLPELAGSTAPTAAEAGGNTTRNSLAALARQPGQTPEAAVNLLAERRATRPDRILDTVSQATGIDPAGARGNVESIIEQGRKRAAPLFKTAFDNSPGPVWNADLAELSQRPAVRRAIALTSEQLQNAGRDPAAMGLKLDPATGAQVSPDGGGLGDVLQSQPTAEAWDLVRKNINLLPERDVAGRVITTGEAGVRNTGLANVSTDLTKALKTAIPGYEDALSAAGDYKSVEGAFNRARGKLLSSKFTPADMSDMMDGMSEGEQGGVQHAAAADLYDAAQNGRLTLNSIKSPAFRAKLMLMYGPDAAGQVSDALANEAQQAAAEQQILPQGGSQTAPLSAAIKEQQENPLGDFASDAVSHTISAGGNPVHGIGMAALKNGAKALASAAKTPGMGTPARDEAGRLLMMSPGELHDYLNSNNFTPNTLKAPPLTPYLSARLGGDIAGMVTPQPGNDQDADPSLAMAQ